jgi:hypothetical protein
MVPSPRPSHTRHWASASRRKALGLLAQKKAVSRFKFQVSSAATALGRASELEGNILRGARNASVRAERVTDICCDVSGDTGRYLLIIRGVVGRLPARDCLLFQALAGSGPILVERVAGLFPWG